MNRILRNLVLFGLAMLCIVARVAAANPTSNDREAKVKAAYVLNFLRFSTWPRSCFADTADEAGSLDVLVLGSQQINIDTLLKTMIGDKPVHGRAVVVRRQSYPSAGDPDQQRVQLEQFDRAIKAAHILYIDASMEKHIDDVLERTASHTLLISDVEGFASNGGMLGLVEDDGRIIFEANTAALETSDVRVSAKVLQLARIVATKKET